MAIRGRSLDFFQNTRQDVVVSIVEHAFPIDLFENTKPRKKRGISMLEMSSR
jgi:hypothetical protein